MFISKFPPKQSFNYYYKLINKHVGNGLHVTSSSQLLNFGQCHALYIHTNASYITHLQYITFKFNYFLSKDIAKQKMKIAWSIVLLVAAAAVMNVAECYGEIPAKSDGGVMRVGGKVLCQDCTEDWNEWVNGHKPIEGIRNSLIIIYMKYDYYTCSHVGNTPNHILTHHLSANIKYFLDHNMQLCITHCSSDRKITNYLLY